MSDMIEVEPAHELRVAFARWAVAQTPKPYTVGPNTFAVPAELFTVAPEEILIGARVDGHQYISPDVDEQEASEHVELLGVATAEGLAGGLEQERIAVPGEPLPEVPPAAYPPGSVPLEEPGSDSSTPQADGVEGAFPCDLCARTFTTERGRDHHRRQKHPEVRRS
ncbi:hypothetical protein ABZX75_17635 [Streptomyces sp. NPDC003038]|uniref:hypothetical protein n=1 Tax=unclassified Streptomyces TaxID=2593676 RepID=UPI0033B75AA8